MCTGARHHCCSAYLTFVSVLARGSAGRAPRPLPRLAPTSALHAQIYEAAEQCGAHAWLAFTMLGLCTLASVQPEGAGRASTDVCRSRASLAAAALHCLPRGLM